MNHDSFLKPETLSIEKFVGARDSIPKVIPRYQRAYSWTAEQVFELMEDVNSAMKSQQQTYFIGAVLCIDRDNVQEIVDGQQRLITISLIFAAALHYLKENDSKELEEWLEMSPDVFKDILLDFLYFRGGRFESEDVSTYKLEVSEFDKLIYRGIIENGLPASGRASHKRRNFVEAYETISDYFQDSDETNTAIFIRKFIQFLLQKVLLVVIHISDESNAYEIFEVLNARNKQLDPVDLIKNKLLSALSTGSKEELDEGYSRWTKVLFACNDRSNQMKEYVRCHLQMREGGKVDPKQLYKNLHSLLRSKDEKRIAKEFLKEIEIHCNEFSAIMCKDARFWSEFNTDIKNVVGYLNDFRVVYTIMISILYAKKPTDFVFDSYKILQLFMKRTRAVKDRFSVMEQYEEYFASMAKRFRQGKGPKDIKDFFKNIKELDSECWTVIPDESFISQIASRPRIKDTNAKAMLIELANHLQRKEKTATKIDHLTVSLEHILPKRPNIKDWQNFENKEIASIYIERLGNLTLLEKDHNASLSNKSFIKKKSLYSSDKCGIRLTNELCDYTEWTKETITQRQERLGKLAAEVWSFKKYN